MQVFTNNSNINITFCANASIICIGTLNEN